MDPIESRLTALEKSLTTYSMLAEKLSQERDKRYETRFSDLDRLYLTMMQSQKELVTSAFEASRAEAAKAEAAQSAYNIRSNEFRQALDDSNKNNIPRPEANARFAVYDDKIDDIKKEMLAVRLREGAGEGQVNGISLVGTFIFGCVVVAISLLDLIANIWIKLAR